MKLKRELSKNGTVDSGVGHTLSSCGRQRMRSRSEDRTCTMPGLLSNFGPTISASGRSEPMTKSSHKMRQSSRDRCSSGYFEDNQYVNSECCRKENSHISNLPPSRCQVLSQCDRHCEPELGK